MDDGSARGLDEHPVAAIDWHGRAVVVRLTGELDLHNAPTLRTEFAALATTSPDRLVVDLADVDFVDSTALGTLVEARATMPARTAFLLASPGLEVRRVLEISGLDRHFQLRTTVAAALGGRDT